MTYYIVNFSDVSKVNITDLFHFSNPKCGFDARFEHIEYINGDPAKGWISNKKTLDIGDKNFLQLMSKPCPEIPGIGCSALKSKKF